MSAPAPAADALASEVLASARAMFEKYKSLGERAMAQLEDAQLSWAPDAESNSIAVLVRHLHGNMRSRWTDVLTTDGEKPDRRRDAEFELSSDTARSEVLAWWDQGWRCLFSALDTLSPADLRRRITIRGEPHTVLQAIHISLAHYAMHVGQIVWIAKSLRGAQWETLSIPRKRP